MTNRTKRYFLGMILLAVGLTALGQEGVLSNIRGGVTDGKANPIQGAVVTLRNQNTGFQRVVNTDESGEYLFNDIVSGEYSVSVEAPGFKKYVESDIDLNSSRTVRVDIAMQIGELVQSVEVQGGTPVIETESPTVSFSARNETMNEVPTEGSVQGGRMPNTYFYVVPGNVMNVGTASFNGLPSAPGAVRVTLDGVRAAESCCQMVPTLEMLDELKVITSGAPAEYAAPTTVELITRQGTNDYHGDAWELYDDSALQAQNLFLPVKQISQGNTFGGSIGMPILKSRLFLYAGFEGVTVKNIAITGNSLNPNNVPTALMQQGNFSELTTPSFVNQYNNGETVVIKNPLTGAPFPNNIIPAGQISSVATYFDKQFWTEPTAPGLVNNQFTNAIHPLHRFKGDLRLDYNLSSRHTIYGRYGQTYVNVKLPTAPFTVADAGNRSELFPSYTGGFSDTFIFNPHITNQFRFGVTRTVLNFASAFDHTPVMSNAGIQGLNAINGIPTLSISGIGSFTGLSSISPTKSPNQIIGFTDHVSYFTGKHSLEFGVQFNREQVFESDAITPPSFGFNGQLSGWSWADFMLGLPDSFSSQLGGSSYYLFQNELGMFAQDEYRMTPHLTISLGLRYQIWPYPYEKYGKLAVFDASTGQLIVPSQKTLDYVVANFPVAQIPVATAAAAHYGSTNSSLINTDYGNVAPRLGFAWMPFDNTNTVVRSGYGIFYYNIADGIAGPSPTNSAFLGSQSATQALGSNGILTPTITFANPTAAFGGSAVSLNSQTLSFNAASPNLRTAMVQEYNFTLEQQWRGWGARASYFGSFQTQIPYSVNINENPPGNQPFSQSRRPVPAVYNIFLTKNGGYTRINGFQFEAKRPLARGFFLDAAYTHMKALTDVNSDFGGNTPTVPIVGSGGTYEMDQRFKSNTNYTPRQQLILTYSYDLPVGRGKTFLGNSSGVVNEILGGWRAVGVTQFQTGLYLTPYYVGVDPVGATPGTGEQLPDRVGEPNLARGQRNPFTGKPFYNTAAFVCPGGSTIDGQPNLLTAGCPMSTPQLVGRYGNSKPTLVVGPGINIWNLSVIKRFTLPRDKTFLEFAAQMSNPWNHPNWESSPDVNLSSASTDGIISSTENQYIEPFSYGSRKITLNLRVNF